MTKKRKKKKKEKIDKEKKKKRKRKTNTRWCKGTKKKKEGEKKILSHVILKSITGNK